MIWLRDILVYLLSLALSAAMTVGGVSATAERTTTTTAPTTTTTTVPATTTTTAAPEAATLEAQSLSNCGNGIYDTKFNACSDEYNRTHQWLPLVAGQFWDTSYEDVIIAMCVLYGESRGRPDVTNHVGARGLFQIMPNWADNAWAGTEGISYADLLTPEHNVFVARQVWEKQGWGAWSAYSRGYVQDCISMNAFNAWADTTGGYHNG